MWLCLPIPKNNPLWYFGQTRCYPADFRQIHVFPEQSDFLVSFSKLVEFKQREGSKVRKGGADTALGEDDTGRKCWSVGVLQCFQNLFLIFPFITSSFWRGHVPYLKRRKISLKYLCATGYICVQLDIFVCAIGYICLQLDIHICL